MEILGKIGMDIVVKDVVDPISVVFFVIGIVFVVTKVVVKVWVIGIVEEADPLDTTVDVTEHVVVVIVMTS